MRPPKHGNDCQRWAERIQSQAYGLQYDRIPEPWPIRVVKGPVVNRPYGLCTVWDALMSKYQMAEGRMADRMRVTIGGLLLLAGADRERIKEGMKI